MPKENLSQVFVDSIRCPKLKDKIDYRDSKLPGLTLKVLKSGKKSYYIVFRDKNGRRIEKRFADASIVSLDAAREEAQQIISKLTIGINPFEKVEKVEKLPTFAKFISEYYLPYAKSYKRSWSTDVSLLKNHLLPVLGKKHLDEIRKRDLISLFAKHRETHMPGSTNRIIILVRFIFNCAIRWDIPIEKNPTNGIYLYPVNNAKERYLTEEEAKRLFEALETSQARMLKYIVSMLLLTGARKTEVLQAKWKDFDLENRIWTIEFTKTGKTRHVPLTDGVLALLEQVPRFEDCEWAFPNPKTKKPYKHIFYAWDVVRKRAGMPELRIHDLRHSFASFLVNGGRSLYEVQKILGHTQIKTTQRYAHLSQDSLRSAADTATNMVPIAKALPKKAEDVELIENDLQKSQ